MDLVMRHDARWLTLDGHLVRDRWLDETVQVVLARSPGPSASLASSVREQLVGLLAIHDRINPETMYALYPSIDDGVVAIAQLLIAPAAAGLSIDDALAEIVIPENEPTAQRIRPPEVSRLPDGEAPALRVRQHYKNLQSEEHPVADMVSYLWLLPKERALLALSSTFYDHKLASRWIDDLDALARGLRLQTESTAGQPFEIRPQSVTGFRGADLPKLGVNNAIRQWCLAVDPTAGTVTWQTRAEEQLLMRLPGQGPQHLPELARVAIADTFETNIEQLSGGLRWLILVGVDGRALTRAATEIRPIFRAMFGEDPFRPLARYGVEVVHEQYKTSRQMNKRYPGAERLARKIIVDHRGLTVLAFVIIFWTLFVILVTIFD